MLPIKSPTLHKSFLALEAFLKIRDLLSFTGKIFNSAAHRMSPRKLSWDNDIDHLRLNQRLVYNDGLNTRGVAWREWLCQISFRGGRWICRRQPYDYCLHELWGKLYALPSWREWNHRMGEAPECGSGHIHMVVASMFLWAVTNAQGNIWGKSRI